MSYLIDRHVVPAEDFVPRQDAACLTIELSRLGGRLDRAQQIDQQAPASSVFIDSMIISEPSAGSALRGEMSR